MGIMQVTPEKPVTDGFEPFVMVQEAEVVLDLEVPEIVPVADVRGVDLVNASRSQRQRGERMSWRWR